MNKTKMGLITLLTALFCLNAQAGVLLEPYLGLGLAGDGKVKSGTTRTDMSYDIAPTAGFRAGYSMWGATLGLDASYQKLTLESSQLSGTNIIPLGETDVDKTQAGIFLGYTLPVPMRVWLSYYFMGNAKLENDNKYTSGSGYAFGTSYTGFSMFAINLEYRNMKYDEFETAAGVTSTTDANLAEMLLSVSMPFDLELF